MQAVTVRPGVPGSLELLDLPEPEPAPDLLLVDGVAVGICGTDREIVGGDYGEAPAGSDHLVLGHESLGRVRTAPPDSGFAAGDLIAGVVRRPDPEPCGACAHGEFDMCRNGRYTERGIMSRDGYAAQVWTVEPEYAVKLDPQLAQVGVLMEPTSVVAKAWEQIERIGARSWFEPRTVLVTGAGPIGLLAALLGVQRKLEVHLLDQVTAGPKLDLTDRLGAEYHTGDATEVLAALRPDIVIEATGAAPLLLAALGNTASYGITCLTGVSSSGRRVPADLGALNRSLVLENDVVVGSVNANLRHYAAASEALAAADPQWLAGLITRRVPLSEWRTAYEPHPEEVKVVLDLSE
ncbi:MAG TPA: glucose 1-dehydrogenase [Sporichthya sp.]|nr:glucose 1-dehydrogenase [Sporichthya sp.]